MAVGELRPPATEDPLLGRVISERYRVIRKLGEGGMGAVYLAEHIFIEKKVALKVLAPELSRREDLAKRFLQEAKSASRIGHENVIDISDFGQTEDGLVYFAMEYLEGIDLGATVRKDGALPWSRAKRIILQICRALRAAHAQGIVHRDLKPENIFVIQRERRPDFVKLLDFGIAKVTGPEGSLNEDGPRLTRTGMIFGTPEYMSPEQAEGKSADHRVDVYATGCLIYHCITGHTPFQADSFMAMLTKHLLEDPIPPSARRPDLSIPPELDHIVLKALEKDRDNRWQNMDAFIEAVSGCAAPEWEDSEQSPGSSMQSAVTKGIGGAENMPIVRTSRKADTAVVDGRGPDAVAPPRSTRAKRGPAGGPIDEKTDRMDRATGRRRPTPVPAVPEPVAPKAASSNKVLLLVCGVLAGVLAAIGWVWHTHQQQQLAAPILAPPAAPPVAPPAVVQPPVNPPAAANTGGAPAVPAANPAGTPTGERPAVAAPANPPDNGKGGHRRRHDKGREKEPGAKTPGENTAAANPEPGTAPPPSNPNTAPPGGLKPLELMVPKQFGDKPGEKKP
jgi:serine/threonine protein kinase